MLLNNRAKITIPQTEIPNDVHAGGRERRQADPPSKYQLLVGVLRGGFDAANVCQS
jgi:hypothetical protein